MFIAIPIVIGRGNLFAVVRFFVEATAFLFGISFKELLLCSSSRNVPKPLRQAIINLNTETDFNKTHQLIGILHQLAMHDDFKILASSGYVASLKLEKPKLSNQVIAYIFKNFNQDIDLNTVAEIVNMNPSAFRRSFKRVHRKTFSKYINEIRIGGSSRCTNLWLSPS